MTTKYGPQPVPEDSRIANRPSRKFSLANFMEGKAQEPMPKTQREWFEGQFFEWNVTTSLLSDQIRKRKQLAKKLTSAWPSSPQGLAAKQLVEVLQEAYDALTDRTGDFLAVMDVVAERIEEVTEAARKAGLA